MLKACITEPRPLRRRRINAIQVRQHLFDRRIQTIKIHPIETAARLFLRQRFIVLAEPLHELEHACWMIAGLLVWTLLIDPGSHRRLSTGGRVALAVAVFASGQVLTDVLVFSFHPLYPLYRGAYGLSASADQKLAGLVMMAEQLLTLGTLVFVLIRPRLRHTRLQPA